MEQKTIIWNPWHGCRKYSEGCERCYVYRRDESIGKDAFAGCTGIEHVYFTGDEWDFRMIDLGEGNELLENANIHYNYVYPDIKEATK